MKKIIAARTTAGDRLDRVTQARDISIGALLLVVPQKSENIIFTRNIHKKHDTRDVQGKYRPEGEVLHSIRVAGGFKILPVSIGEYLLSKAQKLVDHCNEKKDAARYWYTEKGQARLTFLRLLLGGGDAVVRDPKTGTYKIDFSKVKFPKYEAGKYSGAFLALSAGVGDSKQEYIKDILTVLSPDVMAKNIKVMQSFSKISSREEHFWTAPIHVAPDDMSKLVSSVGGEEAGGQRVVYDVFELLRSPAVPSYVGSSAAPATASQYGVLAPTGPTHETTIGKVLHLYSRVATAILLRNDSQRDQLHDSGNARRGSDVKNLSEPDLLEGRSLSGRTSDVVVDPNVTTSTDFGASRLTAWSEQGSNQTAWSEQDSTRVQTLGLAQRPLKQLKAMQRVLYGLLQILSTSVTSDDTASSVSRSSGSTRTQAKVKFFLFEKAFIHAAERTFLVESDAWKDALQTVLENSERKLDPEGWQEHFEALIKEDPILKQVGILEALRVNDLNTDIEGLERTYGLDRLALSDVSGFSKELKSIDVVYSLQDKIWSLRTDLNVAVQILNKLFSSDMYSRVLNKSNITSSDEKEAITSILLKLSLVKAGLAETEPSLVRIITQLMAHLDRLVTEFSEREALVSRLDAQVADILSGLRDISSKDDNHHVYDLDLLDNIQTLFSAVNIQHYANGVLDPKIASILNSDACLQVFPFGTDKREALRPLLDKLEEKIIDEEAISRCMKKPLHELSKADLILLSPLLESLAGLAEEIDITSFAFTEKFKSELTQFIEGILKFQLSLPQDIYHQYHALHTYPDLIGFNSKLTEFLGQILADSERTSCLGEMTGPLVMAAVVLVNPSDADGISIGGGKK